MSNATAPRFRPRDAHVHVSAAKSLAYSEQMLREIPNAPFRACVIGCGGWGTALALHLRGLGARVAVWGAFEDEIADIRERRINSRYLAGVALPPDIEWTSDPAAAIAGADLVVVAAPSKFVASVCVRFRGLVPTGADVVCVAKGLEATTHRRMSEVAAEALGVAEVAALSGPSHAEEVARGVPTAVVVASLDPALAARLQKRLTGGALRLYTSDDPAGVEFGGALKNIIAVAVGVSDGLGFGDNTRAALITRGLAEITRLGVALGARPETFAGLSGMGDLVVTCTSRHSRNRGVGERLGRGETIDDIRRSMVQIAEGIVNCPGVLALAREKGVEMPISELVQAVVERRVAPGDAVALLLGRGLRTER